MSSFELELPEPEPHPLVGTPMVAADRQPIGVVTEVFLDSDTDDEEWLVVELASANCAGCFTVGPRETRFVPIEGVEVDDDVLVSRWGVDVVESSPVEQTDTAITRVEEDALYAHYGLEYPRQWINSGFPGGGVVVGVAALAADSDDLAGTTAY